MKKIISLVVGTLLLTVMTVTGANSAQTLKCQTVISAKADEVKMLKDFTDTVTELTQGSLIRCIQTIDQSYICSELITP